MQFSHLSFSLLAHFDPVLQISNFTPVDIRRNLVKVRPLGLKRRTNLQLSSSGFRKNVKMQRPVTGMRVLPEITLLNLLYTGVKKIGFNYVR